VIFVMSGSEPIGGSGTEPTDLHSAAYIVKASGQRPLLRASASVKDCGFTTSVSAPKENDTNGLRNSK